MTVFYTKKGDKGESIIGRKKIKKNNLCLEALGQIDELNSLVSLVKNQPFDSFQEDLFIIQANLATLLSPDFRKIESKEEKVLKLEEIIDELKKKVVDKNFKRLFVIYRVNEAAARLDYLRVVTRRVERRLVPLIKNKKLDPLIFVYFNRLSSLFCAMTRLK